MPFVARRWTKRGIPLLVAIAGVMAGFLPPVAIAAELLVLEQVGCVYCEKFEREIAPAYPKTAEGKIAPLRRIDIHQEWPEDLADIKPAALTPTFILIDNDRELGRIHGYPGDEHFWFLLGELLQNLNSESPEPTR